jgi:hypothetical protein
VEHPLVEELIETSNFRVQNDKKKCALNRQKIGV